MAKISLGTPASGRAGKVLSQGSIAASSRRGQLPKCTCPRQAADAGRKAPPDTLQEGAAPFPRFPSASESLPTKKKNQFQQKLHWRPKGNKGGEEEGG